MERACWVCFSQAIVLLLYIKMNIFHGLVEVVGVAGVRLQPRALN